MGKTKLINPGPIHFNYDELDIDCKCRLCSDYFDAREVHQYLAAETVDHKWRCGCAMCKEKRKAYMTLLATANKRDLYSELSFLAHDKRDGDGFLLWTLDKVTSRYKGMGWWANHSAKLTLGHWILLWAEETGRPLKRGAD